MPFQSGQVRKGAFSELLFTVDGLLDAVAGVDEHLAPLLARCFVAVERCAHIQLALVAVVLPMQSLLPLVAQSLLELVIMLLCCPLDQLGLLGTLAELFLDAVIAIFRGGQLCSRMADLCLVVLLDVVHGLDRELALGAPAAAVVLVHALGPAEGAVHILQLSDGFLLNCAVLAARGLKVVAVIGDRE